MSPWTVAKWVAGSSRGPQFASASQPAAGVTRFAEVDQRGDGRLRGKRKHPGFCALHIAIVLSLP